VGWVLSTVDASTAGSSTVKVQQQPYFRFATLSLLGFSILISGVIFSACDDDDPPSDPAGSGGQAGSAQGSGGRAGSTQGSGGQAGSSQGAGGAAGAGGCGGGGGGCQATCQIDGVTVAAGALDPANACAHCDPEISLNDWSPLPDGTACAVGQVCGAGACAAQCFIDGALVSAGTTNPANACEQCTPATSTTAWSSRGVIPLLVGGVDITTQGWSNTLRQPATLTYVDDYVRLATSTTAGANTSGQFLLYLPNAYDPAQPFKIRVEALVESVSPHNQDDSGAALLGAFTPDFGMPPERAQMVYLDGAAIGWADDSQSAPNATLNQYHTYELSVDAAKVARVSVDGVAVLTRNDFVTNGTVAVGDQTNDANVDGAMRIRSVSRVCP
jgi:hypothetical protein